MQQGLLQGFDTPPLPSVRAQQARQAALPDTATLRANLSLALRDLPFRPETFESFPLQIVQAKRQAPLDRATLQGSNLGLKLDSYLMQRDTGWVLMMPLRGVQDAGRIELAIRNEHNLSFILLDMKRESDQMFHDYRREANKYAALGSYD